MSEGRPRIAVVLTQLGYGGAEKQMVEVLRRVVGGDLEPCLVVCLSEHLEPYGPVLRELGYRIDVLSRTGSFDVGRLLRLRALLRAERIDLVHGVHLLASGYCALATGFGRRPRLVPTVRGARPVKGWLRRVVYRRMIARCPFTLVNSQRGLEVICADLGVPGERLTVVPNGTDFDGLAEAAAQAGGRDGWRRTLGIPAAAPLVAYVGKDAPVKNIPRMVRVLAAWLARRPEAYAVIAGTGLGGDAASRFGGGLPAGRVHWLGTRSDVPALLAASDVVLLTSNSEGCPNVVIESLALGTPVVSGDVGDVRAIVGDDLAPLIVAPDDVSAYVEALDAVVKDPAAWRQRALARRPALEERFGMTAMVRSTTATWHHLLQGRAGIG